MINELDRFIHSRDCVHEDDGCTPGVIDQMWFDLFTVEDMHFAIGHGMTLAEFVVKLGFARIIS